MTYIRVLLCHQGIFLTTGTWSELCDTKPQKHCTWNCVDVSITSSICCENGNIRHRTAIFIHNTSLKRGCCRWTNFVAVPLVEQKLIKNKKATFRGDTLYARNDSTSRTHHKRSQFVSCYRPVPWRSCPFQPFRRTWRSLRVSKVDHQSGGTGWRSDPCKRVLFLYRQDDFQQGCVLPGELIWVGKENF